MIVVSDTSPLNYLVLIGAIDVLPQLFGEVYVPPRVMQELQRSRTPEPCQALGPIAAGMVADHETCSQSSICKPPTRENSLVLLVTSVKPCTRQIAAIWRSYGPMLAPATSRA